ncbi:MAG: hypothetical protein IJA34_07455 [Lachnospiraceae bacterium]|nr:hypothetical protein [Lachnospiraceae bacterium]
MKNKRQFFSLSLYIDALKQLRVIGIVILVFVGFVSTSAVLSESDHSGLYALSLLTFLIFSPVMTLYIFRFLTNRKASDVFHSLPNTRVSMYVSYVSAVFTYILASLTVNLLAFFAIEGNFEITVEYILSLIVCNMLVISAITLAQGMTGTIFTNISVAGIILFFPRLLMDFVIAFVCEFCPFISRECIKFPFGKSSNILTEIFIDGLDVGLGAKLEGIIYTFSLSVIYFVLAVILFNRRKSEVAGAPATNRLAQHIIRIVITLVICLQPLSSILYRKVYHRYYEEFNYNDIDLGVVIIYFFAVFVYFIYELLSTKKVKNLVKVIPGIIVVAILNVAIVFSIFGITEYIKKFQPKADEVEYVIIHNDYEDNYEILTNSTYFISCNKDGKITDKRIIKLLCDQFKDECEEKTEEYGYRRCHIGFCVDGKIYDRYFGINETRFKLMLKYLAEKEDVLKAYRSLPEYDELEEIRMGITGELFVDKDKKDIYEKYREDLSKITSKDVMAIIGSQQENDGFIKICYYKNNKTCYLELPFIKELPTSYNKYLELADESTDKYMGSIVDIAEYMLLSPEQFYFSVTVMKSGAETDYVYLDYDDILEHKDELLDEKVLGFCKEAADTYKLPDIEETVYDVCLGNRNVTFSASVKCMELFMELKKYQ